MPDHAMGITVQSPFVLAAVPHTVGPAGTGCVRGEWKHLMHLYRSRCGLIFRPFYYIPQASQ